MKYLLLTIRETGLFNTAKRNEKKQKERERKREREGEREG